MSLPGEAWSRNLGNGWSEALHPDDVEKALQTYSSAFDAREPFVMQYRVRRHDGEFRWITDQGVPRYGPRGNFRGYVGACVDITDLLEKERALHEFEERVVLAAEATHHGVWELDTTTNELWMSDKARSLFQFDPHARLDETMLQSRVHPDDRALRESAVKHAIETQGDYAIEYRVLLPDGTLRWISGRGRCVAGKDGKGKRLIGVSVDVTQQKEAQDLFRLAAEGSRLGVWHWNEVAKTLTWDGATREMFGVSADAEITIDTFYRALHPDDAERVKQTWRQAFELGLPYQIEFRTQGTDGTIRWVDARGRGSYDESGKPLSMAGVVFDITDRKEAEELFRLATEASPSGILLADAEGRIVLVNAHIEELFGYGREELIGQKVEVLVPERFRLVHSAQRVGFLTTPQATRDGCWAGVIGRRKDGREFPVEIGLNPIPHREALLSLPRWSISRAQSCGRGGTPSPRTGYRLGRVSLLGEMTASLAHELNQPLSAIMSNANAAMRYIAKREA